MTAFDFSTVTDLEIPEGKVTQIDIAGETVWKKEPNYLTFTSLETETSIWITRGTNINCEYSLDNGLTWNNLSREQSGSLHLATGASALIRGVNPTSFSTSTSKNTFHFFGGKISVSGSVMSLVDGLGYTKVIPSDYYFSELFRGALIVTTPELPATTLTNGCYDYMFYDCRYITSPPILPATTMKDSCYKNMFQSCVELVEPPELPATVLDINCYSSMFSGCSKLTYAPDLPATTLTNGCYSNMFYACNILANAPYLPATELADKCYFRMFRYCNRLKIKTDETDKLVFTCPSTSDVTDSVTDMFANTGGTFTGTPTAGTSYYWYE